MRIISSPFAVFCAVFLAVGAAPGAFLIQVDVDGVTNDPSAITFSPNFSFGAGTTSASGSATPSNAVGLAPGNTIFGGNAAAPDLDTYVFTYTPSTTAGNLDNLTLAAGTPLNGSGSTASGMTAGASGLYAVYATWPSSTNVSGGLTNFSIPHDGGSLDVQRDQIGTGHEWLFLGNVELTEGNTYRLSQIAGSNTFVSMRSAGVLFDAIPEPSSALLVLLAGAIAVIRRQRRTA